jgi:hypothetical protein
MGAVMTPKARSTRTICRRAAALAALVVASSLAAPAGIAAPAALPKGTMMIGAERLFGLSVSRISTDTNNGSTALDQTHFGLFAAPGSQEPHVYLAPRLALDYALIDGLTLGGSLAVAIGDYTNVTTTGGTTTEADLGEFTTFLLAPRVGYALGLSRLANLWLRGGLTYFNGAGHGDVFGDTEQTRWGLAVNLEPTFLLTPLTNLGFTVGLVVDVPVAGKRTTERTIGPVTTSTSVDQTVRNFGVQFGMVGMF